MERKASGSHYTPPRLAQFVAKAMTTVWSPREGDPPIQVLDPAIGDGELMLALVRQLDGHPGVRIQATGFDTDREALASAAGRIREAHPAVSLRLHDYDFLDVAVAAGAAGNSLFTEPRAYQFDFVIANPPYVRTQVMGAERARRLAAEFGLSGRVDLYFAFLSGIAAVLRPGGLAGVIVSNRFMTTRAGAAVRKLIRYRFDILHVWDLGDTKLFEAAVLPAVLLLRKKDERPHDERPLFTSIYSAGGGRPTYYCDHPLDAADQSGLVATSDDQVFRVRQGTLDPQTPPEAVWRVASAAGDEWLATVAAHTVCRFADVGKVRVGVKTTADRIFARSDWDEVPLVHRPELLRPLMTHHVGRRYRPLPVARQVVYPHEVVAGKRRAVDLSSYPRSLEYLTRHREELEARTYVKQAGRQWFEIWVPQDPNAWARPKVVFRDITERPAFWMDLSGSVINGDCYWITRQKEGASDLLWLLLAVGNSTFIEAFYDHRFNNKLYAGRRRFMTQYVEEFPLPAADTDLAQGIVSTVKRVYELTPSAAADQLERKLDRLVWRAFGLPVEEVAR